MKNRKRHTKAARPWDKLFCLLFGHYDWNIDGWSYCRMCGTRRLEAWERGKK